MRIVTVLGTCAVLSMLSINVNANEAQRVETPPVIDGDPSDTAWSDADWKEMKYLMLGKLPEPNDFSGRYKVVWSPEHLYLIVEITDDVLIDSHPNPLEHYWEDDALEILIDADHSGGLHQFDYNAFAYHIALDNTAVDIGPFASDADRVADNVNVRAFPDHIVSTWKRDIDKPHKIYWEVQMSVFGDDYDDGSSGTDLATQPIKLSAGKTLGFMVAYCDADSSAGREHFMGDVDVQPVGGNRNLGYIDASVFEKLTLIEIKNK